MTLNRRLVLPVGLLGLALLVGYTWAFHDVFTSRVPGANDFFSRWAGARLYLIKGWDPYGEDTSLWIQNAIWGHPAGPNEDPSLFAYPFYTIFLVAPYALFSDYAWAQAAWQVTLQLVALLTLWLCLRYFRWRPRPAVLGGLVLWMVIFYPTARSLILGQIGVLVFALTVGAFWLMLCSRPTVVGDAAAGIFLAVTTIKPQMQFLIIPLALLWALRERRWATITWFAVALGALIGVSLLLLPAWIGEWLAQVANYPAYTPPAVLNILTHEVLRLGGAADIVEPILDALLLVYLLFEWWLILGRREDIRMDWVIGLTLVVTHLIAPRTATTHFIVFVFALVPIFRDLFAKPGWGGWAAAGLMLTLGVGMWWLFFATISGKQESDLMHVPLPLFMLVVLLIARPKALRSLPVEQGSTALI